MGGLLAVGQYGLNESVYGFAIRRTFFEMSVAGWACADGAMSENIERERPDSV